MIYSTSVYSSPFSVKSTADEREGRGGSGQEAKETRQRRQMLLTTKVGQKSKGEMIQGKD
jgi:hypothetical protein